MTLTNEANIVEDLVIGTPNDVLDDGERDQRENKVLNLHQIFSVTNQHAANDQSNNAVSNYKGPVDLSKVVNTASSIL